MLVSYMGFLTCSFPGLQGVRDANRLYSTREYHNDILAARNSEIPEEPRPYIFRAGREIAETFPSPPGTSYERYVLPQTLYYNSYHPRSIYAFVPFSSR
jgi:hypothetical protein